MAARRSPFEVPRAGRRVLIDTDDDAHAVVEELATALDLARPYRVRPAPLETTVHEDASGPRILFVINPGKRGLAAEVSVPGQLVLEDLISGDRFEGRHEITIPMRGWSCRMLSLRGEASEGSGSGTAVAS